MWNAARKNFPNVPDLAILQIDIALSDIAFFAGLFRTSSGEATEHGELERRDVH